MLFSQSIVNTLLKHLKLLTDCPLVIDPVMVSSSGHPLLEPDCIDLIMTELIPRAALLTPNIQEAEMLLKQSIGDASEASAAAEECAALFQVPVLLKGGHLPQEDVVVDYFADGVSVRQLEAKYVKGRSMHGTGCTLSAAITAEFSKSLPRSHGRRFSLAAACRSRRVRSIPQP